MTKTLHTGENTRQIDDQLTQKEIEVFGEGVTLFRRYSGSDHIGTATVATQGMINAFMYRFDGRMRDFTREDYLAVFNCYPA